MLGNDAHGFGIWSRPDGTTHTGTWKLNKFHGFGMEDNPNVKKKVYGEWERGNANGKFTIYE